MTQFTVTHFERADRPTKELACFKTDSLDEARATFADLCAAGGPVGSGVFFFDFALFGGTVQKHIF